VELVVCGAIGRLVIKFDGWVVGALLVCAFGALNSVGWGRKYLNLWYCSRDRGWDREGGRGGADLQQRGNRCFVCHLKNLALNGPGIQFRLFQHYMLGQKG